MTLSRKGQGITDTRSRQKSTPRVTPPVVDDPVMQRALNDFAASINRALSQIASDPVIVEKGSVATSDEIDVSSGKVKEITSVKVTRSGACQIEAKGTYRDSTALASCLLELREDNAGGVVVEQTTVKIGAANERMPFLLTHRATKPARVYVLTATVTGGSAAGHRIAEFKIGATTF